MNKDGNEMPDQEKIEKTESQRNLKRDQPGVTGSNRRNTEAVAGSGEMREA